MLRKRLRRKLRRPSDHSGDIAISSSTLLAEHTAEQERGRAYAAHFALTHACWLITYWAVGQSSSKWGPSTIFTAVSALCLMVSFTAWLMGRGVTTSHSHAATKRADEDLAYWNGKTAISSV